jgi:hypothetical protein
MLRNLFIVVVFILTSLLSYPQSCKVGFQLGTGLYSMHGLKSINDAIVTSLPYDSKIVSNFPPFFSYRPYLMLNTGNFNLGLRYTFNSTGSRISSHDYSGEYKFDMRISSQSLEIIGETRLEYSDKFEFLFYSGLGVIFSGLKMDEFLEIMEIMVHEEHQNYRSFSIVGESGFTGSYLLNNFNIELSLGYLYQFGFGSYYNKSDESVTLWYPSGNKEIKHGWNGLRIGLGITYMIDLKDLFDKTD